MDDADWGIRCITVDTGNWWPGERVLISPLSVREIDWADSSIHLNANRQKVKDGPPAYDETFLTYYGIRWVTG